MRNCSSVAALFVSLLILATPLRAEHRALLVSVPRVPQAPGVQSLEGPDNDVDALRKTLVEHWGFADSAIRTLQGSDASRAGILDALDLLTIDARSGDFVLIYFSGHGVSSHDPATGGYGMRPDTGAIVPADFEAGSREQMLARLIVGSRDLRPRFERLDGTGAETLVLFDSCYSGDSAKSPPRLVARAATLPRGEQRSDQAYDEEFLQLLSVTKKTEGWPYKQVIYLSASARHELAWDIPSQEARSTRRTIDGRAHGAFTNGLLLGLRGNADRDRDGKILYAELQEYLWAILQRDGQTPQLRPSGGPVAERTVFGRNTPLMPEQRGAPEERLRVRLETRDRHLESILQREKSIIVTEAEYDLEVRTVTDGFRIYLANGAALGRMQLTAASTAALLGRHARAQRIVSVRYPAQDMRLQLSLEPEQGGVYYEGELLQVSLTPGQKAWLLLLAIDSEGGVITVYPSNPEEAAAVPAGATRRAIALKAGLPFGTDRLEAFAFRDKPEGYEHWIGRDKPFGDSDMETLLGMLVARADFGGRARASRTLHTKSR